MDQRRQRGSSGTAGRVGRDSRRIAGARAEAALRGHALYGDYFPPAAAAVPSATVDPDVFAAVLSRYFADAKAPNTFVSAEEIGTVFSGEFVLYRADWSRRFFRASKLDIRSCDRAMRRNSSTTTCPSSRSMKVSSGGTAGTRTF